MIMIFFMQMGSKSVDSSVQAVRSKMMKVWYRSGVLNAVNAPSMVASQTLTLVQSVLILMLH